MTRPGVFVLGVGVGSWGTLGAAAVLTYIARHLHRHTR